ncbi:MAG: class I SAM-dependent methyltransferase [Candidatus Tagabacteria bacterium]
MKPILEPFLGWMRIKKIRKYIPRGGRVCDICCGKDGTLLLKIKDFIKEGVGYDMDVENSSIGNISFKKKEIAEGIDEKSDYFDCAILLAAIEHLDRPQGVINECFRILKPGGIILLTTPSPAAKKILEFFGFKFNLISAELLKTHKRYFNEEELLKIFTTAGFRKEKIFIEKFEFGYNSFIQAIK